LERRAISKERSSTGDISVHAGGPTAEKTMKTDSYFDDQSNCICL